MINRYVYLKECIVPSAWCFHIPIKSKTFEFSLHAASVKNCFWQHLHVSACCYSGPRLGKRLITNFPWPGWSNHQSSNSPQKNKAKNSRIFASKMPCIGRNGPVKASGLKEAWRKSKKPWRYMQSNACFRWENDKFSGHVRKNSDIDMGNSGICYMQILLRWECFQGLLRLQFSKACFVQIDGSLHLFFEWHNYPKNIHLYHLERIHWLAPIRLGWLPISRSHRELMFSGDLAKLIKTHIELYIRCISVCVLLI